MFTPPNSLAILITHLFQTHWAKSWSQELKQAEECVVLPITKGDVAEETQLKLMVKPTPS